MADVEVGDLVTILGKWLSPESPLLPFAWADRKSCELDRCELAK